MGEGSTGEFFGVMEVFSILIVVVGTQVVTCA